MSANKANKYTAHFKDEAVKLAHNVGAYQAARDLGISNSTIYKWVKESNYVGSDTITASSNDESTFKLTEENKRLKKELARVKEEREILKKATSFFASLEK